ncbi:MAG TPA: hypothetical protein VGL59_12180 [Polyangia bacterium]
MSAAPPSPCYFLPAMFGLTKVTAQTELFTVIDNLLSAEVWDRLWNYFQIQPMNPVRALGLQGHWLLEDSDTLRGPTIGWGHKWDAQYPSGAPIDDVMKAMVDCAPLFAASVGRYQTDWKIFSAMPTIYQVGQGLVWHRDSEDNTGSWIFYAHNDWNIEWGGELLLSHAADLPRDSGVYFHRLRHTAALPAPPPWQSHLDNSDANDLLMASGFGSYVLPKPNRLVVIKGGTPHAIAKIRPAAGSHVRASIGGFFKKASVRMDLPAVPWTV